MIKLPRIRLHQGTCKFLGAQFATGIFEWGLENIYTTRPTIHVYPDNMKTYTLATNGGIWYLFFIPALAHELVHWVQWVRQRPFSEKWPTRVTLCLQILLTIPTTMYLWEKAEWSVPNKAVRYLHFDELVMAQHLRAVAASGPRPSEKMEINND